MIDFPSNPTPGQVFNTGVGPVFVWDGVAWTLSTAALQTALRKNLFTNPAIQISQETGNVEGTGNGYYAADQWFDSFTASGAAFGFGRVVKANPSGSQYRLQFRVTTAKAVLAANDYAAVLQKIEGVDAAILNWASAANQKDAVLQFAFNGPAGTYCICLRNAGTNNCAFNALFTITAAQALTDTLQTIKIPAPGASFITWATDNSQSIEVWIAVACGTGLVAPSAGWVNGGYIGMTGMTNGIAAVGTFQAWDFGFYPDPLKTGMPPIFEVPDYSAEERRCQRYWEKPLGNYRISAAASSYVGCHTPFTTKRILPTFAYISTGATASASVFQAFYGGSVNGVGVQFGPVTGDSYNYGFLITANARM